MEILRLGSLSAVEVEHATHPLATLHPTITAVCDSASTLQQLVSQSLVVALMMIVRHVLDQRALKR